MGVWEKNRLTRKSILLVQTACQSVVEAARWVARERVGVVRPVDLEFAAGSLCVALFGAACCVENVAVSFMYIYYFFLPALLPALHSCSTCCATIVVIYPSY